jgi:hypothetical protein
MGNRTILEIGESLVLFQISIYYARIGDLNRFLNYRVQDIQHPEIWDKLIENILPVVSTAYQQVDSEIQQALERLARTAT